MKGQRLPRRQAEMAARQTGRRRQGPEADPLQSRVLRLHACRNPRPQHGPRGRQAGKGLGPGLTRGDLSQESLYVKSIGRQVRILPEDMLGQIGQADPVA